MADSEKPLAVIADDSEYFCLALEAEFKKHGYETWLAGNGAELRELIHRAQPLADGVIVADIQMPIENGDLVLKELRELIEEKGFHPFLLSSDIPEFQCEIPFISKKLKPHEMIQRILEKIDS